METTEKIQKKKISWKRVLHTLNEISHTLRNGPAALDMEFRLIRLHNTSIDKHLMFVMYVALNNLGFVIRKPVGNTELHEWILDEKPSEILAKLLMDFMFVDQPSVKYMISATEERDITEDIREKKKNYLKYYEVINGEDDNEVYTFLQPRPPRPKEVVTELPKRTIQEKPIPNYKPNASRPGRDPVMVQKYLDLLLDLYRSVSSPLVLQDWYDEHKITGAVVMGLKSLNLLSKTGRDHYKWSGDLPDKDLSLMWIEKTAQYIRNGKRKKNAKHEQLAKHVPNGEPIIPDNVMGEVPTKVLALINATPGKVEAKDIFSKMDITASVMEVTLEWLKRHGKIIHLGGETYTQVVGTIQNGVWLSESGPKSLPPIMVPLAEPEVIPVEILENYMLPDDLSYKFLHLILDTAKEPVNSEYIRDTFITNGWQDQIASCDIDEVLEYLVKKEQLISVSATYYARPNYEGRWPEEYSMNELLLSVLECCGNERLRRKEIFNKVNQLNQQGDINEDAADIALSELNKQGKIKKFNDGFYCLEEGKFIPAVEITEVQHIKSNQYGKFKNTINFGRKFSAIDNYNSIISTEGAYQRTKGTKTVDGITKLLKISNKTIAKYKLVGEKMPVLFQQIDAEVMSLTGAANLIKFLEHRGLMNLSFDNMMNALIEFVDPEKLMREITIEATFKECVKALDMKIRISKEFHHGLSMTPKITEIQSEMVRSLISYAGTIKTPAEQQPKISVRSKVMMVLECNKKPISEAFIYNELGAEALESLAKEGKIVSLDAFLHVNPEYEPVDPKMYIVEEKVFDLLCLSTEPVSYLDIFNHIQTWLGMEAAGLTAAALSYLINKDKIEIFDHQFGGVTQRNMYVRHGYKQTSTNEEKPKTTNITKTTNMIEIENTKRLLADLEGQKRKAQAELASVDKQLSSCKELLKLEEQTAIARKNMEQALKRKS